MGRCAQNTTLSLYELQRLFSTKQFLVPEWQRDDAWPLKKKADFDNTVLEKAKRGLDILTGCVILYTTEDDPAQIQYISDGFQRTLNSKRLFVRLQKERGQEAAETALRRVSVPVLYMSYKDEKEAKVEFRKINQGTPLTPFEQAKTLLTELDDYEDWDRRIFQPLHHGIERAKNSFPVRTNKAQKQGANRHKAHLELRDDYTLLLRYLTKDIVDYSKSIESIDDVEKSDKIVENQLKKALSNLNIDEAERQLKLFLDAITEEVALIRDIWRKLKEDNVIQDVDTVTSSCLRSILQFSIHRRNADIPLPSYQRFIRKLLLSCQGGTNVRYQEGIGHILAMGNLSTFGRLQIMFGDIIDPTLDLSKRRKRRNTEQLLPGHDFSHKKPFSLHGEGEVTSIPSILNRSNGTRETN